MSSGLQIQHFKAGYCCKKVVNDISVANLPCGKVVALLGPNGCGKTTLLRALAGLGPAQGKLLLDDVDLMQLSFAERAAKVVYLPQTLPAGVHLHVLESIIVAQRAASMAGNQQQVMTLLQQLGIDSLALSYLDELSGGQKQLVGLAQSLIRHPSLLLLDEPLSALDLNHQFHVMEVIKRETRERDMVTVVVLHDINIALRHAEYILMLKQGKVVVCGEPQQVITPQTLAQVYGVQGRVECCSRGVSQVVIDGLTASALA
ncbi:MAG: ABC transporter ATP-binding protein [Enterobacteriaceae bacterium]